MERAPSGLFGAARSVAATLLAMGCTRLALARTELEEERLRLAELLIWATAALFCAALGIVFAALLLVLLAWNGPREAVLGALALGFLGAGAWAASVWRQKARDKPPLLATTLAELERDAAAIAPLRP